MLDRIVKALGPRVGYWYMWLLNASIRAEYRNQEVLQQARESHGQYVLVSWHSRLVMMIFGFGGDKIASMSSTHPDAQMLVKVLRRFGVVAARGSSSRAGAAGLRQLLRMVRDDGRCVGFTPDGPGGPRRRAKGGVIATARFSGKPLIPMAFGASRGLRIRSWDRMLIPYPFARGIYLYGDPIEVPRNITDEEAERLRVSLEQELDRLTDEVDRAMGFEIEDPRSEPAQETS